MCKFSNATDGNYQKVADVLARWAEELKEATKKEDTKPVGSTSFLQEAVTDSDPSLEIKSLSETITRGTSLEGTSRQAQRTGEPG